MAWVESVWRDSPETDAFEMKLESQTALSPSVSGGISGGGFRGSKVRVAKLTGCLVMVTADVCCSGRLQEMARQLKEPRSAAVSSSEVAMNRREGKTASAFYFRGQLRLRAEMCERG